MGGNTRCFTPATAHGVSITNTTIATPTGNCSPAWLEHSKSADNGVMNGSTRKSATQNDITMDNLIAKTILQQIGGHRFAAMTGKPQLHQPRQRIENEPQP